MYTYDEPISVDVFPIYTFMPEDKIVDGVYMLYRDGYYIRYVSKYAGPLYYLATKIIADKGFEVRKC